MSADCGVGLPVVRVVLDAPGSIADRAKQELFPGGPDYTLPNLKRRGMFASAAPDSVRAGVARPCRHDRKDAAGGVIAFGVHGRAARLPEGEAGARRSRAAQPGSAQNRAAGAWG